jgi:chloride channel 3/4/5
MPKSISISSYFGPAAEDDNANNISTPTTAPSSPLTFRRAIRRPSVPNLRSHLPPRLVMENDSDEHTSLLAAPDGLHRSYTSVPATPGRNTLSRQHSLAGSMRLSRNHSRANSWGLKIASMAGLDRKGPLSAMTLGSVFQDERVWYDQFTSTDWVHDSIADGCRVQALRKRKGIKGRLWAWFDSAQGWLLVAIIGCVTACIAYFVDVTESAIFDLKEGYCSDGWYWSRNKCCVEKEACDAWRTWSNIIQPSRILDSVWIDFIAFVLGCIILSEVACYITLFSKTVVPSNVQLAPLDEDLGSDRRTRRDADDDKDTHQYPSTLPEASGPTTLTYYSAAGSGVAEVKVILSGFVLHGYLGLKTLFLKTIGLIFAVASGLSLGKEGPYVHIATCVGNIACRFFSKYNLNDGKRREVLSASAASGVGVAFGAPIGGVLFSLEEVSYYFPPKTLFRTFFCCIVATLSLKFLNPYGTGKIVIFQVRYFNDWQFFELFTFILLGVMGGAAGALFIKASRIWATTFRRIPTIKKWPMLEVALVALITGITSFWNRYTKLPVTELLFELASPCNPNSHTGLCPEAADIPKVIRTLLVAFVIKAFLTIITFGIKLPAGIYVPSMVVGGLMGRIVGHITQYLVLRYPTSFPFASCPANGGIESCVTPGVYALIAAGATMCGVTRLSVTLAVILFELSGDLDHVLPFSLAVLCAKWTADAIEPLSIYDLLTEMNSYPFLDNKVHPIFDDAELGDIVPRIRRNRIIDISHAPLVRASELRQKLHNLHMAGELDGGLPILRHNVLVGLIPAPDLEFALDRIENEENALCLMASDTRWHGYDDQHRQEMNRDDTEPGDDPGAPAADPTDFTPFIDPAPVALDVHSPMDLVYQCFVKLGLRYMCVLRDGQFAGMVHKKGFVKFIKELEAEERKGRHR